MTTNEIRKALRAFARAAGVRPDWHEPDAVTVRVEGRAFDNAGFDHEKHVVLKTRDGAELRVNLATLIAMAAGTEDGR